VSEPAFDDLSDVYEAMIDWPRRLAREEPFYRRLFERLKACRVLDVACGTGRHAAMFQGWGLQVEGADISPQMIERARANFGEPAGLRWVVRGFDQPIEPGEPFDVALCVGNSLALAPDTPTAQRAIEQVLHAIRDGGALVIHVLNLWRLSEGPTVWQKCARADLPRGDVLIIKGVHRCGSRGFVDLLVTDLKGEPEMRTDSVQFLGLQSDELERWARQSGAQSVRFFGGYGSEPYDPEESVDLLMIAEK
jgi:SAM-dependent methyltransferase